MAAAESAFQPRRPLQDSDLAFTAAPLRNESLDLADQQLAAAAIGDDVLALAWLTAGDLYVSVARGGSFLQARRVSPAQHADLTFSPLTGCTWSTNRTGRSITAPTTWRVRRSNLQLLAAGGTGPQPAHRPGRQQPRPRLL
jgi:hypothetical protein